MLRSVARTKQARRGKHPSRGSGVSGNAASILSREGLEHGAGGGVVVPTEREIRSALQELPEDLSWEWARPRLAPLFERPGSGSVNGDPRVHALTSLGIAVGFGIEVDPIFVAVTESMARRWEATVEQIRAAAFARLEAVSDALGPQHLQHAVQHGYLIRALGEPGGWASSVILAGVTAIERIFGPQDQVFTTPARNQLLSFDAQTPARAIGEITVGLEELDPHPLLLDPFVLHDGLLTWEGLAEEAID